MKNITSTFIAIALIINFTSCKNENKKKVNDGYTIDANKTEVNWTAFKTTTKVPVKGKFLKLNILNKVSGKTFSEAINGVEFSIPVSSVFSNNLDRDTKLEKIFFGVMKNTDLLSGTIHISNENSGYVDFNMNAVVEKLPFSYTTSERSIDIKTIMNTNTWQAQAAISALNEVCFDLHKGTDGVSKTWSDVAIDISVYFK